MSHQNMSHAEMMAWGAAEGEARIADLRERSAEGLKRAQENAEQRRKAVGLTRSQAASIVSEALRAKRIAAARGAA